LTTSILRHHVQNQNPIFILNHFLERIQHSSQEAFTRFILLPCSITFLGAPYQAGRFHEPIPKVIPNILGQPPL